MPHPVCHACASSTTSTRAAWLASASALSMICRGTRVTWLAADSALLCDSAASAPCFSLCCWVRFLALEEMTARGRWRRRHLRSARAWAAWVRSVCICGLGALQLVTKRCMHRLSGTCQCGSEADACMPCVQHVSVGAGCPPQCGLPRWAACMSCVAVAHADVNTGRPSCASGQVRADASTVACCI
jgi:hypothetical protein